MSPLPFLEDQAFTPAKTEQTGLWKPLISLRERAYLGKGVY
jgi:hypothetical protein